VSSGGWKLDEDSELHVLIPWLDGQRDPETRALVLECIATLLLDPIRPALEDAPGVFSIKVPNAPVALIWHVNPEQRIVLISHIGPS
jgi:hypothetical protein